MWSDGGLNNILPRVSLGGVQNKQRNGQTGLLQQRKSRQRRQTVQTLQIQDHDRHERRERKSIARCRAHNAYRPKNPFLEHRRTASAHKRAVRRHEHSRTETIANKRYVVYDRRTEKKTYC